MLAEKQAGVILDQRFITFNKIHLNPTVCDRICFLPLYLQSSALHANTGVPARRRNSELLSNHDWLNDCEQ